MNRYWNLREEIYKLLHNWPAILAAVLLGCLLGLGLSYLWPAHYRATSQVYLALNPYRRYEDTMFEALSNPKYSNLDNYQYWQMQQLESAVYLESFLQPTLDGLQAEDPYWEAISIEELRAMLSSEWRTTGTWSLMANHPDPEHARQAVRIWSDVSVQMISKAVEAARNTFMIDQELQADENALLKASLRLRDLTAAIQSLQSWQQSSSQLDPGKPLEAEERWQVLPLATWPAEYTPPWIEALKNQPPAEAPREAYHAWIDQLISLMETETSAQKERTAFIDQRMISKVGQYSIELHGSLGFSPNIEVQRKEDLGTRVVRPSSTFILIGGIIGMLIWLLTQLIIISASRSRQ